MALSCGNRRPGRKGKQRGRSRDERERESGLRNQLANFNYTTHRVAYIPSFIQAPHLKLQVLAVAADGGHNAAEEHHLAGQLGDVARFGGRVPHEVAERKDLRLKGTLHVHAASTHASPTHPYPAGWQRSTMRGRKCTRTIAFEIKEVTKYSSTLH